MSRTALNSKEMKRGKYIKEASENVSHPPRCAKVQGGSGKRFPELFLRPLFRLQTKLLQHFHHLDFSGLSNMFFCLVACLFFCCDTSRLHFLNGLCCGALLSPSERSPQGLCDKVLLVLLRDLYHTAWSTATRLHGGGKKN